MNTRREFLALFRGAVIGGAAAVAGFRGSDAYVPEPVSVPMPEFGGAMVSWTASPASTTTFTVHDDVMWYDAHGTAAS